MYLKKNSVSSSGFVFLRLICPAIVNPRIFNIIAGELLMTNSFKLFLLNRHQQHFWQSLKRCLLINLLNVKKKCFTLFISADPPSPIASRTLTLVAKAVQNLANLVEFGAKVNTKTSFEFQ